MTPDEKIEFLESMGFEIYHETSNVGHSGFNFNLSATRMEPSAILSLVIGRVYKQGQEEGKNELQAGMRELLGCDS